MVLDYMRCKHTCLEICSIRPQDWYFLREKQNIPQTFDLIDSTESLLLHGFCFLQLPSSLRFASFPIIYSYLILSSRFSQLPEHSTTRVRPMSSVRFLQQIPLRNWNIFLVSNNKAAPCSLDSGEVFSSITKRKQKHSRSSGKIFRCALCVLGDLSAVGQTEIILLGSSLFSKAYLIVMPVLTKHSKTFPVKENTSQHILFTFPSTQVYVLPPEGNWNMLLSSFIRLFYSWVLCDIGFWIKLALNKFLATALFPNVLSSW